MNYLRVVINGESWGVYLNAAAVQRRLHPGMRSSRRAAPVEGAGQPARARRPRVPRRGCRGVQGRFTRSRPKTNPRAWAALMRLCQVLNTTPPDRLEAALAPILDIDATLKFLAVEIAMANSDGYWTRASDYNIYRDTAGRFHLIPARRQRGARRRGRSAPRQLDPMAAVNDPTQAAPLEAAGGAGAAPEVSIGYLREIAEKWLDWNTLLPIAEGLARSDCRGRDGRHAKAVRQRRLRRRHRRHRQSTEGVHRRAPRGTCSR